jgi:hypothetical protein
MCHVHRRVATRSQMYFSLARAHTLSQPKQKKEKKFAPVDRVVVLS